MAYRDYILCKECEDKLIYDGYDSIRDRLEEKYGDPEKSVWTVSMICPNCLKKFEEQHATRQAEIDALNHEAENQMNRIQELQDKLQIAVDALEYFADYGAVAATEALARIKELK